MKIAVRYYTRSGNTRKLAEAIAQALNVEAQTVDTPLAEKTDLLFLGSSYYAFDVDPHVKSFLVENQFKLGKVVRFGTSAMLGSTQGQIAKVTETTGTALAQEEFHCPGSFGPFHKGRPNAEDCQNAAAFAKNYVNKEEQK